MLSFQSLCNSMSSDGERSGGGLGWGKLEEWSGPSHGVITSSKLIPSVNKLTYSGHGRRCKHSGHRHSIFRCRVMRARALSYLSSSGAASVSCSRLGQDGKFCGIRPDLTTLTLFLAGGFGQLGGNTSKNDNGIALHRGPQGLLSLCIVSVRFLIFTSAVYLQNWILKVFR